MTARTTTTKRLAWGLQPPANAETAWGARTVYKYNYDPKRLVIDILHDRMATMGPKGELKALCDWINDEGLPALRLELAESCVTGDDDSTVRVYSEEGAFVLKASPNASYGYLYIVAYVKP